VASDQTLDVVRAYHGAWTCKNFEEAAHFLSPALIVEVPNNDYPSKDTFAAALRGFGGMVRNVNVLAAMCSDDEAMLLYDLDAEQLGWLRVVEHFTVAEGLITRLRQIHDTAPVRASGLASSGA
jgi:hypothetical protein